MILDIREYEKIEEYMLSQMHDSAHDRQHVYRVLYTALEIAETENGVDKDILIAACLLHDIARGEQLKNPGLCHAVEGGKKAYDFLVSAGWEKQRAERVKDAITTHRFRRGSEPESIEAKILFDADKIDVAGAIGIARTLMYRGNGDAALYSVDENGEIVNGEKDKENTFFNEYKFKLEKIYDRFYTKEGKEIAERRRKAAVDYYNALYEEISESFASGKTLLESAIVQKKIKNFEIISETPKKSRKFQ